MQNTRSRLFIALAALAFSSAGQADLLLATTKNCMACHAVSAKLVGPSFQAIAKRYAGQPGAVEALEVRVLKGGAGVWGQVPMPANGQASPEEVKQLVAWVLGTK
jgi:cytochrome c